MQTMKECSRWVKTMFSGPTLHGRYPAWPVHLAGGLCLLGYAVLAWYSQGRLSEPSLTGFFALVAWVSLPLLVAFYWSARRDIEIPFAALFLWAVAFRLCGLVGAPLFEDDYFRYLWDGYRFAQDATPYAAAPAEYFSHSDVPTLFQRILDQINYPDIPTIYGPTTQLLFLASYVLSPGSLLPLKVLLVALDLLLIVLLRSLCRTRYLLLYAWCPLVIKEIAFTAHPDILGVALLMSALLAHGRGWRTFAGAFLALAVGAKVFALLLAPFILAGRDLGSKFAFALVLAILYAPFIWQGHTEFTALQIFAREWEFNSAVYDLVSLWLDPQAARFLLAGVFVSFLIVYWYRYIGRGEPSIPRGDWIFGLFLILSPTINPWYLLWLLPFAVIYPTAWAWVSAYAVLLSYVTWINLGNYSLDPFAHPWWVKPVEFGLILLAFLVPFLRRRKRE